LHELTRDLANPFVLVLLLASTVRAPEAQRPRPGHWCPGAGDRTRVQPLELQTFSLGTAAAPCR